MRVAAPTLLIRLCVCARAAIVFNGLLDHLFFDSPMTLNDLSCFSVILCATYLYANVSKDYKPPVAAAATDTLRLLSAFCNRNFSAS